MKVLKIKTKEFQIDDEDFEWINDLGAWRLTGLYKNYASLSSTKRYMGQVIYLHRLIMLAEHGHDVIGMDVDHIDRNPFNCQKGNMRLVTEKQNTWNRTPRKVGKDKIGSSKYIGVQKNNWFKNNKRSFGSKWTATFNGKYIGIFNTQEEAAKAYDKKAIEVRGKFAQLNFFEKVPCG